LIDKDKIPESIYDELVEILGQDEAEKFISKEHYNFRAISNKILIERLKQRYGKRFWIYFWIAFAILMIIYFLWLDF